MHELKVVLGEGGEVTFDQTLTNYEFLAAAVRDMVAQHLMAQKRSALDGGRQFGPVILGRDGIAIRDKAFTWDQVRQCSSLDGQLVLYPKHYRGSQCEEK